MTIVDIWNATLEATRKNIWGKYVIDRRRKAENYETEYYFIIEDENESSIKDLAEKNKHFDYYRNTNDSLSAFYLFFFFGEYIKPAFEELRFGDNRISVRPDSLFEENTKPEHQKRERPYFVCSKKLYDNYFEKSFVQGEFSCSEPIRRSYFNPYKALLSCDEGTFINIARHIQYELDCFCLTASLDTKTQFLPLLKANCQKAISMSDFKQWINDNDLILAYTYFANNITTIFDASCLLTALALGCIFKFEPKKAIEEYPVFWRTQNIKVKKEILTKIKNDILTTAEIKAILEKARQDSENKYKQLLNTYSQQIRYAIKANIRKYILEVDSSSDIDPDGRIVAIESKIRENDDVKKIKDVVNQYFDRYKAIDYVKDHVQCYPSDELKCTFEKQLDNQRFQLRDRIIAWLKSDSSSKELLEERVEKLEEESREKDKKIEDQGKKIEDQGKKIEDLESKLTLVMLILHKQQPDKTMEQNQDWGRLMSQLTHSKDNGNEIEHEK